MAADLDVVFVSHVDWIGGAERSLLDLVRALAHGPVAPTVVLPGEGELARELERSGVPVRAVGELGQLRRLGSAAGSLGQLGRLLRGARAVEEALRALRPSLVHANSTTAALFAGRGARRLGVPLVWHLRDLTPLGWVGRALERRCARVVVTSRAVESLARRFAAGAKVVRIPSGIDTRHFAASPPAPDLFGAGDGVRILSVGQLVPWKRHDLLLDCAAVLAKRLPDARIVVLGDRPQSATAPSLEDWRAEVRARGLERSVRFAGWHADVAPALAAADLLLHTAYPEPYGRALVEAMAAGVPVIALGGEHGPAETVRDGVEGTLVEGRDAASLADAVCHLAGRPDERRRMGRLGRERAAGLGHERSAALCVELYRTVLASGVAR